MVEVVVEEGRVFSWEVADMAIELEEDRVFSWEVVDVLRSVTSVVSGDVVEVSFCCCEEVGKVVDSSVEMAGSSVVAGSGVVPKRN